MEKILPLVYEIAQQYADLEENASMCFHMDDHDLYKRDTNSYVNQSTREFVLEPVFTCESATNDVLKAWNELNDESGFLVAIYYAGIYFIPGRIDHGIIWSKSLEVALKNPECVANAQYLIKEVSLDFSRELLEGQEKVQRKTEEAQREIKNKNKRFLEMLQKDCSL